MSRKKIERAKFATCFWSKVWCRRSWVIPMVLRTETSDQNTSRTQRVTSHVTLFDFKNMHSTSCGTSSSLPSISAKEGLIFRLKEAARIRTENMQLSKFANSLINSFQQNQTCQFESRVATPKKKCCLLKWYFRNLYGWSGVNASVIDTVFSMSHVAHERARLKIRNRPMAVDKTKKHMFIPKKCAKGCCHSTVSTKNHVQQNCVHVSIWWLEHVPANVPFLSSLHLQKTFAFCPKNPSVYYTVILMACAHFLVRVAHNKLKDRITPHVNFFQ